MNRRSLVVGAALAFLAILIASLSMFVVVMNLQGSPSGLLSDPVAWLLSVDNSTTFETVANTAELLAAILAIVITVVAIVVELAANRYSHRITSLFVREPVNIVVMSFFVIATIQSIWISLTLEDVNELAILPHAGFVISIAMVTVALIILLPYFAFVMSFLSPVNVIERIRRAASASLRRAKGRSIERTKSTLQNRVDELQDIARRASEQSDRAVAMAAIDALCDILMDYQEIVADMPDDWFSVGDVVTRDPDFVSLGVASLNEIELAGTWVDVKIMRQYLSFVISSGTDARDSTYLIAINTKRVGIEAIQSRPQLVELCIRCFNSYLRATINNNDQRTSYYIMNQYRQLAEELLARGETGTVDEISLHFQFYGLLGFRMNMPFLLEVAAYDVVHLLEKCIGVNSGLVDRLLELILELDQEIREELNEDSLLGVRRAQLQLAAHFFGIGDTERAMRICRDLRDEQPERLERVRDLLMTENRRHYWELTDRGVNFSYLDPALREHLDTLLAWIREVPTQEGDPENITR